MHNQIRETCPCGAVLEFSETVPESYNRDSSYRQSAFHKAHEECRKRPIIADNKQLKAFLISKENPMPNNKSADELDETKEAILIIGFLYGIQSDFLPPEEVKHRVAGFKNTKGYKEAKSNLKSLIQAEVRKAITITLKEIKWVEYPPSGKEYHFKSGGWSNSLTDATNRIKALTKSKQEE